MPDDINRVPLKMIGQSPVRVSDIGAGKRRADAAIQHRPRERATVGLSADSEAGRRFEHDRSCRRYSNQVQQAGRHSRRAEDIGRIRSVRIREERNSDAAARRRFGTVSHVAHDPGVFGKHARYCGGVLFNSAIGARDVHGPSTRRKLGQYDGARRSRAGAVPPDRQLGCRT